jgi:hypothetical protein
MRGGLAEQRGGVMACAWKHCSALNFFFFLFPRQKEKKK